MRVHQQQEKSAKRLCDAFHILNRGGQEALLVHIADSEHASIAQAMQFFGFREGSLDCLFPPGVDASALIRLRKRISLFQVILPYMARHQPSRRTGSEALFSSGTIHAIPAVAPVFSIAFASGCSPCQLVFLGTDINVAFLVILKSVLSKMLAFVSMTTIADNRLYPSAGYLVTGWR